MASIKIAGDTSGEITISAPAVAGTNTLTIPASTGNIITTGDSNTVTQGMIASGVATTGPAFHAGISTTAQSITSGVWTKIEFDTERFDTASCFDNVTNYRFTPTVAGYYHVGTASRMFATSQTTAALAIYKNGSGSGGVQVNDNGTLPNYNAKFVSGLVYMNGTTDYLEVYGYIAGTTPSFQAGQNTTYFYGYLARAD